MTFETDTKTHCSLGNLTCPDPREVFDLAFTVVMSWLIFAVIINEFKMCVIRPNTFQQDYFRVNDVITFTRNRLCFPCFTQDEAEGAPSVPRHVFLSNEQICLCSFAF